MVMSLTDTSSPFIERIFSSDKHGDVDHKVCCISLEILQTKIEP
jgi:hypothetical protein